MQTARVSASTGGASQARIQLDAATARCDEVSMPSVRIAFLLLTVIGLAGAACQGDPRERGAPAQAAAGIVSDRATDATGAVEKTAPTTAEALSVPAKDDPMSDQKSSVKTTDNTEVAILAGGCFWGMEDLLRGIDGVIDTEVGYCGGQNENATYENHPGHAEAVRVVFDPAKIPFKTLLVDWFFRIHDPTTLNRQGNDRGSSYRSTIFYVDAEQKRIAEEAIREVEASGKWDAPVVTTVEPVKNWSVAEPYHQDYLEKNPGGYTCHWLRP
jgi:methionine-S-sulfoxide reductase